MNTKVTEFQNIRQELVRRVNNFPKDKVSDVIFDKWSLKDVLAHLNHWIEHDIDCLEAIKQGKEAIWYPDVEAFNTFGVNKRKSYSWDQLYDELITQGAKLIELYNTLPENLWQKKFWEDKDETPAAFLQEDIDHWKNEHLPQLGDYK